MDGDEDKVETTFEDGERGPGDVTVDGGVGGEDVNGGEEEEHQRRRPHEGSVLKTTGEIRRRHVIRVPGFLIILINHVNKTIS